MSAIWLEFPPNKLAAIKTAYLNKSVMDGEAVQDSPMLDATGTRALIGSSRITQQQANELGLDNAPWLKVHTEFPADWQYAAAQ